MSTYDFPEADPWQAAARRNRQMLELVLADVLVDTIGVAFSVALTLEPLLGPDPLSLVMNQVTLNWLREIAASEQRSAQLARMPYKEYLRTDEWQTRREAALNLAEWRCQLCNAAEDAGLHVHHRTYERRGQEHPGDLTVLCAECHRRHHRIGE